MSNKIVLQTQDLTKHYGPLTAVDGLSLAVYRGEVFGFLGPNGAGKTTSINMICGLLKPDAGWVRLNGERQGGRSARALVGFCPQEVVLWERLTCLEQLQLVGQMYGLPASAARQSGERLLAELDLAEKRSQQARRLSGGMRRRLNLALALVHDPEIVVLDEPEAGLDPQSRVRVRNYLHSLARRKTIILTTHNMDEAERLADRVAIIDHGRLLELDTPQALKRRLGAGDVLEIGLGGHVVDAPRLLSELETLAPGIHAGLAGGMLILRGLNLVALLPAILQALNKAGASPAEVRLRANTLEDVFIQLTGRSLRE